MEQGLHNLGSSMLYLQKKINVIANNISNSDTNGFKEDMVLSKSFNSILSEEMKKSTYKISSGQNSVSSKFEPGIYVDQIMTLFKHGALEETGKKSDIAISGDGFFSIDTNNGSKYVRSASISIDKEGFLSILSKGRIQGLNGDINVGDKDYIIDKKGMVYVNEKKIDTIKVVDFINKEALEKTGNGMYMNLKGKANIINTDGEVWQEYIETSNVDLTKQMIDMVEVSRSYETSQRMIQMLDQIHGLAANEIGKV